MWWLLTSLAVAQDDLPELNAQLWRPSVDARQTLWADDARTFRSLRPVFRLYGGYVNRPLSFVYTDDGERTEIVSDLVHLDLTAGLPVGPARLGVHVPVFLLSTTDSDHDGGAGLGDLAFDLKGAFLSDDAPVGLGASVRVLVPTSTVDLPLGLGGVAVELAAIVDLSLGRGLLAANLGYRVEPAADLGEVTSGDPLFFRLGGGIGLTEAIGLSLDVAGQGARGTGVPVEALLGGWVRAGSVVVRAGGGRGFTTGVGSSGGRALLSVGWESAGESQRDRDHDGLVDRLDLCPTEAEDVDQFKDDDGCPDLDDDVDGVPDVVDDCPRVAEDLDGVADEDGCPETAVKVVVAVNDLSGLPVRALTATFDGGVSVTGDDAVVTGLEAGAHTVTIASPRMDTHTTTFVVRPDTPFTLKEVLQPAGTTGVADLRVSAASGAAPPAWWTWTVDERRRPIVPGVGFTLPQGTWELLVAADGYRSVGFELPIVAGAPTGVDIVLSRRRVAIDRDGLTLSTPITFATGVTTPSDPDLLDEIAEVLWDHPDARVRIEVHTDSVGSASTNKRTSQRRADAIRDHLVKWGIDASRIEALGMGEDRLLDPENTPDAHARNRRVVFVRID